MSETTATTTATATGGGEATTQTTQATTQATPPVFAETLPADIRGEAAFRDIKDLDGLARSYLHAQRLVGATSADRVVIPAEGDADGWNALFGRLGRPEAPDKYALTDPKLPDGMTVDATLKTGFVTKAHEAGLTNRQAAALYDWYNGFAAETATASASAREAAEQQAIAGLKTEWGQAFDAKLTDAKAALAHYGGEDLVAYLNETRLGNDPRILKTFAALGAQLREDGIVGRGGGAPDAYSPAEAQQQINGLKADAQFMKAYTSRNDPGHKDAVAKMQRLYAMAFPAAA